MTRRLRRAARSLPEPPTALMPPVPAVVADYRPRPRRRCASCGRPIGRGLWCCWVCRAAADGGWQLDRWNPGAPWHDVHTEACELAARARDPRWFAGSARSRRV